MKIEERNTAAAIRRAATEVTKHLSEIDWEQRRYEIAKEMLPEYMRESFIARNYGTMSLELSEVVSHTLAATDELIKQLKEKEQ